MSGSWGVYYRSALIYWLLSCYCFARCVLVHCAPSPGIFSHCFITSASFPFSVLQFSSPGVWGNPRLVESSRILAVEVTAAEYQGHLCTRTGWLISCLKVPVWLNTPIHVSVQTHLEAWSPLAFNCFYHLCALFAFTWVFLKTRRLEAHDPCLEKLM